MSLLNLVVIKNILGILQTGLNKNIINIGYSNVGLSYQILVVALLHIDLQPTKYIDCIYIIFYVNKNQISIKCYCHSETSAIVYAMKKKKKTCFMSIQV